MAIMQNENWRTNMCHKSNKQYKLYDVLMGYSNHQSLMKNKVTDHY